MHRSGTSLTTQWLYKCGLPVGDNLMEPSFANVQGYFEDLDFVNAHVAILQKKNLKPCGMVVCDTNDIGEQNTARLNEIIRNKNQKHLQWGWKDPRTCLFLNTYARLIPDAYYLVVLRNFEETISSLITRHYKTSEAKYRQKTGFSRWLWENYKKKRRMHVLCRRYATHYLKVWVHYNQLILQQLQTLPNNRYIVVHSSLLRVHDIEVFAHLTNEWNFSLHYIPFNTIYTKALWSNKTDVLSYIKDKQLLARAQQLQQALVQYATIGEAVTLGCVS